MIYTLQVAKATLKSAIKRMQCELAQTLPSVSRLDNRSTAVFKSGRQN